MVIPIHSTREDFMLSCCLFFFRGSRTHLEEVQASIGEIVSGVWEAYIAYFFKRRGE